MPVSISLLGRARGQQPKNGKREQASALLDVEMDEFFQDYDYASSGSTTESQLATSMTPGRADIDAGALGDNTFSRNSLSDAIGFDRSRRPISWFDQEESKILAQERRDGVRGSSTSLLGRQKSSNKAWGHTSIDGDLKVLMPGKPWRSASKIHPMEHEALKKRWPRSGTGASWEDLWGSHQFGLPTKAQRRGL